jgi:hypothetical protein
MKIASRKLRWLLPSFLCLAAMGCAPGDDGDDGCEKENTRQCSCPDGSQSLRICLDGEKFSECRCDAGVPPAAGNGGMGGAGGAGGAPPEPLPPDAVANFTLTDINPSSSTFNQSRSLHDNRGKVLLIYYTNWW